MKYMVSLIMICYRELYYQGDVDQFQIYRGGKLQNGSQHAT